MGYSSRYHAASLVAVFVALAIGILIGAGLGGNVLNDTEQGLRNSLEGDLHNARAQTSDLRGKLAQQQEFASSVYPLLVGGRLANEKVGVVALGELPGSVSDDISAGLQPTGGSLAQVSVVKAPPDLEGLADALKGTQFAKLNRDPSRLNDLGRRIGGELAIGGGKLVRLTRDVLLDRSSGEGRGVSRIVLVRQAPGQLPPDQSSQLGDFENGVVDGIRDTGVATVGVETSDSTTSSVPFFKAQDIATVDDVDMTAGQLAMVFALLGARGDYGVKDSADRLLPELLSGGSP